MLTAIQEDFTFHHSETPGIDNETSLAETTKGLQKLIPVVLGHLRSFKCVENVLRNALDEHANLGVIAEIDGDIFLRTHKSLQTLFSLTELYIVEQETRIKTIESCLSVVSTLGGGIQLLEWTAD